MSEFDINIGSRFDTTNAETQLKNFIEKYNGEKIDVNLNMQGTDKLQSLEKNLNNISNMMKAISNIKVNVNSNLGSVDSNIADGLNKNVQSLIGTANNVTKQLAEGTKQAIASPTKQIEKNLGTTIDKTQQRIGQIKHNLESLKSTKFINVDEIDKMVKSLDKINNTDFNKFGQLGLNLAREEIDSIVKKMSQLNAEAKNSQLGKIFGDVKVTPLLEQMNAVREVISAKGLSTEGIDILTSKLKSLGSNMTDLTSSNQSLAKLKSELGNLKISLNVSDVKSYETAIKSLEKYKNELNKKIAISVDNSEIKQLTQNIETANNSINNMKSKLGELGKNTSSNLGNIYKIEDVNNLSKIVDKTISSFENLKNKANSLKNTEFIDISKISAVESYIQGIQQSLNSLDMKNLKSDQVQKLTNDVNTLNKAIESVKSSSSNLKLEAKFDLGLERATSQINGLHSALISTGNSTAIIEELKNELSSISNLAKIDLGGATAKLQAFISNMKQMANTNFNIKNIGGDLNQYLQILKQVESAQKKALSTSDVNIASSLEQQAQRGMNALKQLESGFNQYQQAQANAFKNSSSNGSSQFGKEINAMVTDVQKLQAVLNQVGQGSNFSNLTGIGGKLSAEFEQASAKVIELGNKLQTALNSGKIDSSGIQKIKAEIQSAKDEVASLGSKAIDLKCEGAIAELEQMRQKMALLGKDTSGLDTLINKFNNVNNQFKNGTLTWKQASAQMKSLGSEASRVTQTLNSSSGAFTAMGTKVEGFFSTIKNSFASFGLGMMISRAVMSSISGIKSAITELDASLTDIARVLPDNVTANTQNLGNIANQAREIAISVGQSTEDVIEGMATALRAGANTMEQATAIAKSSAIFQNVTDMSADSASQAVASLINQYYSMDSALSQVQTGMGKSVEGYNNLTEAMDLVNYAGNNFAISSDGVAQALQRGGSVLSNYGVTLADSVAMISGANESLQNPEKIGNGLKSIAINLSGMKTNAKEGTLELNKTAKSLKEIAGIDVYTDSSKTTIKGMVELIDELKGKWGGLTDAQQKGLSEGIAGKQQAQVFQALMTGWDRVKQFQQEYNKGWMIGSAQRENEIFMDSIAGKWNTLKENMKALVTSNASSDMFKDMLDGANNVVVAINKISEAFGKIGTAGSLIGIMTFINGMSKFSSFTGLTGLAGGIKTASTGMLNLARNTQMAFSQMGAGAGLSTFTTELGTLTRASGLARMGMIAFNAVLNAMAWAVVIGGITMAVKALDNYVHATENAIKASKEKQDGIRDELSTLNTQKSGLGGLAKEYDLLSSKTKLSYQEMSKLSELKKKIAEINPELIGGYDENGDPILKLNGSLTDYVAGLDKAINKQQKLFNAENKKQSNAYKEDNDGAIGQGGSNKWINVRDNYLKNTETSMKRHSDAEKAWTGDSIKLAEKRQKYRKDEEKSVQDSLGLISKAREEQNEKDIAIQAEYSDRFLEKTKITSEKQKNEFNGFLQGLDWSTFNDVDADKLYRGLETLSEKTVFTTRAMGENIAKATSKANSEFEKTGAINTYGKELQKLANESGKFDLSSWSGYLENVNEKFASGSMTTDEYNYSLGIMAQTMSDLTNVPVGVFLESLKNTGDLGSAFENASSGLNNFMSAYDKSIDDLSDGKDSIANKLAEQFEDISQLGAEMDEELTVNKKLTVDWLLDQKNARDLPEQMNKMIDLVTGDGEVTEVEQKVLMYVQSEIENKGELQQNTISQLEGLLDGSLEIGGDGIEIAGLELSKEEALELQKALQSSGKTAEEIALGDTGIEDFANKTKEVEKALSKIKDEKLKIEFEAIGFDNSKEIGALKTALKDVPEKKRVEFVSEVGQFFKGTTSVEQAMDKIPPEKKLKYNIGVEGNEKLESAKKSYDALPKEIRTKVDGEVYGIEDIKILTQLVDALGEKNATAILQVDGAEESLSKCNTVKEFLEIMNGKIARGEIQVEANTEEADGVSESLEELDGKTATASVELEDKNATELYNSIQEYLNSLDGKKTKSEHTAKSNDKELKETEKEQDKLNGKKTESEHEVKAKTTELEEGKKKQDEQNGKRTESEHVFNFVEQGKKDLEEANKEKDKLEKTGQGTTLLKTEGADQLRQSIENKDKLEKPGTSTTTVQIPGSNIFQETIGKKEQLETNGSSTTTVQIPGSNIFQETIGKKNELETTGTATTNMEVNGTEKVEQAKQDVDNLDDKEVNVGIGVTLKETIDSVLAKLGLSKSTANVEIRISCVDEATPVLERISSYKISSISFNIKANGGEAIESIEKLTSTRVPDISFSIKASGGEEAKNQVKTISSTVVSNKNFSITCSGAESVLNSLRTISSMKLNNKKVTVTANTGTVLSKLNAIAKRSIPSKKFSIVCKDSASAKLSRISGRKMPNKTFSINCSDKASSKISSVQSKKISNKSFTVSCKDNATSKLNTIINRLSSISSKTITVTTRYNTVGSPPQGGGSSFNQPNVIGESANSNVSKVFDSSVNTLDASTQAFNNSASTLDNSTASTLASVRKKTNIPTTLTMSAIKYNIDLLTRMTNVLKKVSVQVDILNGKQERAFGKSKTKLIQQEIDMLRKQKKLVETNIANMGAMSKKMKSYLKGKGFKFNDDGSIYNYSSKLVAMEKNVEKLKKKEESYKGKSEKTRKKLSNAYSKANDKLQLVKSTLGQYYDLQFSQMPGAKKEWEDLANSIVDAKNELIEAKLEMATFKDSAQIDLSNTRISRNETQASTLLKKGELSSWQEQIKLIEKANKLLIKNQLENEKVLNSSKNRAKENRKVLEDFGFKFGDTGYLLSGAKDLEKIKGKDEYEAVKKAYDQYIEDMYTNIPKAEEGWQDVALEVEKNKDLIEEIKTSMANMIKASKLDTISKRYEHIGEALDLVKAKMEGVYGENKKQYIEEQIALLEKQKKALSSLKTEYLSQMSSDKDKLTTEYEIKFDSDGNIANLTQIMNSLDTEEKRKKLQELADSYNENLSNMNDATKDLVENSNEVNDLKDSLLELKQSMDELYDNSWTKEYENSLKVIQNQIDRNESKLALSGANEKEILEKNIELYKKLAEETQKYIEYQENKKKGLEDILIKYDFKINDDGTIDGTADKLKELKNTLTEAEFEYISKILSDYFEVALDKIPELEDQLLEFQKKQEEIQKGKLETTQKVEQEITKIYKKQIDDRIKKIEEEKDKTIEALNKSKEAYNKWRSEVEYNNDYEEQLKKVQDLQTDIESAKRDTSDSGKKRLEELMEQLKEEQKNLEKLVQDKIDQDINDMFDDQIEDVENKAEEEIKSIEDLWSDSKIAEMIKEALETGLFTDIDGNITKLDEALLEFSKNSEEYLGVMGDSLRKELLDNLGIAIETMTQLDEISKNLSIPDFSKYSSMLYSSSMKGITIENQNQQPSVNTITIGDTILTIEGNVDDNNISDIENLLSKQKDDIVKEIMNNVK